MKNVTPTGLAPAEQRFADEVLAGKSQYQAAILAGYGEKNAHSQGSRLARKANIAEYIAAQQKRLSQKALSRQDKINRELEAMAFARIAPLTRVDENGLPQVDWSNATPEQLAAVTSLSTKTVRRYDNKGEHIATEVNSKFSMADKYRGLELLAKMEGMLSNDKVEVVVDVADRLLNARQRLAKLSSPGDEETE